MSSTKYIGMDLHSASISTAVVNDDGKLIMEATIATEASAVLGFIGGLQGTLRPRSKTFGSADAGVRG